MRVFIVGGFGFVGGRLADYFSRLGHEIIIGSRSIRETPDWLPRAKVKQIVWDDIDRLRQSCEGVNLLIHAAGMNSQECAANPQYALNFKKISTMNLVEAAALAGVENFLYLSTAHVYSNHLSGKVTEDYIPSNSHPYALSHLIGEQAVLSANFRDGFRGLVIRLSNAFGAPMHKDVNCWMLLVNDLCKQAVLKRKLVLKSDGKACRDFIPMADACIKVSRVVFDAKNEANPSIFNVGAGISLTVLQMAQFIQKRCFINFGFNPTIELETKEMSQQMNMLIYESKYLSSLARDQQTRVMEMEIDRLLIYSMQVFSN